LLGPPAFAAIVAPLLRPLSSDRLVRRNALPLLLRGTESTTRHEILFIISSHPDNTHTTKLEQLIQGKSRQVELQASNFFA